ncbi:MAG: AAA family ATPase [Phycisphaerales bacterium]
MFKHVTVKNLRAITHLTVNGLGRVNLFVGRNACGKTTFLEGIFFLVAPANPRLLVMVNVNRGLAYVSNLLWPTYFHNMDMAVPIEIVGVESETGRERRLLMRPAYEEYRPDGNDLASTLFPPMVASGPESTRQVEGLRLEYDDLSGSESRIVSEIVKRNDRVAVSGTNRSPLLSAFLTPVPGDLHEAFSAVQQKKRVSEVVDLLKDIEPELTDLRLSGSHSLLYADVGASELIPINLMGGGIMRFLSVALAMLTCQNGVVLIDEIESGLHHSAQSKLWSAVFSWAQKLNVQVFATTHSAECIKAFSDRAEGGLFEVGAKLFRIERDEDKFRAVEYTRELLAESIDSNWEVR